jgi:serine/threonine protein kinase
MAHTARRVQPDNVAIPSAAMNPESFQHVRTLFAAAVQQPAAEALVWLRSACGSDSELYEMVQSLVAADQLAEQGLELTMEAEPSDMGTHAPMPSLEGRRVGSYQVVREIGRGGMGVVYLARRADNVFSKALCFKVVRPEKSDAELIRRFHREREIVARLDHPNIARMLDGGTTEEGLPYAIMEHVEGQPIDVYCDRKGLTITERIQLIRTVCAAVQYAHQNLVVHLDLKPSHIVVKADGTVKLLDFGIARLLRGAADDATADGTFDRRLFTLAYASPEQIKGDRITTASDVYSLGVVLYQLLTGHPLVPTHSVPLRQVIETACEREPVPPSEIVLRALASHESADGEPATAQQIAAVREGTPGRLARRLAGEIDNIVMMALRKEPERRYASIEQLSEDLHCHLAGRPVLAQGDTALYRARKFVARHRSGVALAAFVLVFMALAIVATGWQARVARQERARAEREAQAATAQSAHAAHQAREAEFYRQRAEYEAAFAREQLRLVRQRTLEAQRSEQRAALERERADRRARDARAVTEKLLELNTGVLELDESERATHAAAAAALVVNGLRSEGYTDPSLDNDLAAANERIGRLRERDAARTPGPPRGWQFSSREPDAYESGLDMGEAVEGASAYIRSKRAGAEAAELSQTISAEYLQGRRIRVSAMLRSRAVEDVAVIFVRMNDPAGDAAVETSSQPALRGTNHWTDMTIVFDVPRPTAEITFGFRLKGAGLIAADEFTFEIVEANVPLSGSVTRTGPTRLTFERVP